MNVRAPRPLLALAALAALLAGGVVAASAAVAAPTCAGVLFLGARGSGEPLTAAEVKRGSGQVPGYGSTVDGVRQEVLAAAAQAGVTVESQFVPYPAADVSVLYSKASSLGGISNGITEFFGGLKAGVGGVISALSDRALSCPAEQIVLAGYSQGAMVMHRAVNRIEAVAPGTIARVRAVVLIADGDQLASTIAERVGSAPVGSVGIAEAARLTGVVGPPITSDGSDVPIALHGRVQVICQSGDVVCAFTVGMLKSKGSFNKARAVHESYAGTTLPSAAGQWAGSRLSSASPVEGVSLQWVSPPVWTYDPLPVPTYRVTSTVHVISSTPLSTTVASLGGGLPAVYAYFGGPTGSGLVTGFWAPGYNFPGAQLISGTVTDGVWQYVDAFPASQDFVPGQYVLGDVCLATGVGSSFCRAPRPSEDVTFTLPPRP